MLFRLFICALQLAISTATFVVTTSGPVLGKLIENDEGVSYYAYQGIPYAESPTGALRFKPPVPKKPWTEVLNATEEGPICPQPEGSSTRDQMSEDCLTLNIYVPKHRRGRLLPVLFYVHGGGFKANSGNIDRLYGPQLFLQRDIIFVSLNYRLGALGYLSLETDEIPGNAGIKDALLALQWINKNIRRFGGNTITAGGSSSGAALIHYLLLTDRSTGLLQRSILQSGSATNFRFFSSEPKPIALALASQLGFNITDIQSVTQKLKNANAFDIVDAQENIYKDTRNFVRDFTPFVPCIEKDSSHAIVTKHPREVIKSGIPQNMPILTGINSREGIYQYPTIKTKSVSFLQENFTQCVPADINYPKNSTEYESLVNSMSNLYFGDTQLSNWSLSNFYDLLSDTQYTNSVDLWIRTHVRRTGSKPVYFYLFDFEGDLNWGKINYNISFPGMAHADELGYIFVTKVTEPKLKTLDTKSERTLENSLKYFSNFIKFGNPTPALFGSDIKWPLYGKEGHHLILNDEPKIALKEPFKTRFDFWNKVYLQYENSNYAQYT